MGGGGGARAPDEFNSLHGTHDRVGPWIALKRWRCQSSEIGGSRLVRSTSGDQAVLSFTGSLKIYVAVEPCDMRKGFEGLLAMTASVLQQDIRSGGLYVFTNRKRSRLKVLYFDGSGLWLMTKRLERGTFSWPVGEEKVMILRPEAFAMLTDGVDLRGGKMRPWYDRETASKA